MATYKGIEFPDRVAPLARHMDSLNDHREALAALSGTWDTLALLAHLSNLETDMGEVRQSFGLLAGELLGCLAEETLALASGRRGHQAQIAIDVLTRNLFERTADIGFLATDSAIVEACADAARLDALRERLRTYASLYTVYSDIVLMAPDGQVLCRLRDGFAGRSGSGIVRRALQATGGYVESFEPTDFCGGAPALTYAGRVERDGHAVGVLALEFDLAREARLVFDRLAADDELVAFVDRGGRVVVANDAARLPAGLRVAPRPGASALRLGGVSYVFEQRAAPPYQGYAGPGWTAIALAPVELAFQAETAARVDVGFSGEAVFSPRLLEVPVRAREIQRRLDRMVWNGRVQQTGESNAFSRSLLEEIAATGRRTKDVFERASAELLETVAAGVVGEARFLAGLAVDILDRNLYERANDCRWWAASPALGTLDAATVRRTLARLNELYTVYANIVLFDGTGRVIAASRDAGVEGCALLEPWVVDTLGLRDPLRYVVSKFEPSELYGGRGTYIYAAPILQAGRAVGGIGLVFDGTPQFEAMLRAALPEAPGSVAAFSRRDGTIVSRTGELPLALPAHLLALAPGEAWSGVLAEGGQRFVVGAAAGSGYREFKTSDGYDETLVGVVVVPCGQATSRAVDIVPKVARVEGGTEVATFLVGAHLVGVEAREVVECIEVAQAVRVWRGGFAQRHVGFVTWRDRALPLIDAGAEIGAAGATHRHAIVLKAGEQWYGLLVTELGPVAEMKLSEERGLTGLADPSRLVAHLARAGSVLIPVLSPGALFGGPK